MTNAPASASEYLPDLRSGAEVAEILAPIIAHARPREASVLATPAVVLAISGLKGTSYVADLGKLDRAIEELNIRCPDPLVRFDWDEIDSGRIYVHNLAGIERTSRSSKLPGILPFNSATGFEGYERFLPMQMHALEREIQFGSYPPEAEAETLFQGIFLGYPDQAILDFERAFSSPNPRTILDLPVTDILNSSDGGPLALLPHLESDRSGIDLIIREEHAADPGILDYARSARRIVREFEATALGRRLRDNPKVQTATERRQELWRTRRQLWFETGAPLR